MEIVFMLFIIAVVAIILRIGYGIYRNERDKDNLYLIPFLLLTLPAMATDPPTDPPKGMFLPYDWAGFEEDFTNCNYQAYGYVGKVEVFNIDRFGRELRCATPFEGKVYINYHPLENRIDLWLLWAADGEEYLSLSFHPTETWMQERYMFEGERSPRAKATAHSLKVLWADEEQEIFIGSKVVLTLGDLRIKIDK